MAGELWNRVNIPFPSATSTVHINVTEATVKKLWLLSAKTGEALRLLRSEALQTEIRVLYELLYILNNSYRGNKTLKGLQQVEQCVNRLKDMHLEASLQELGELCPKKVKIMMCLKTRDCEVPSQPKLEWTSLRVLGAIKLLSCTLSRCSRAFLLSKQQIQWKEFIVLSVVITSMLSRLWVLFRGLLLSLSSLYQLLADLVKDVARAQPMPYLTDFTLPADVAQFLGPSDAYLLKIRPSLDSLQKKAPAELFKKKQKAKIEEDLGISVERGLILDTDVKLIFGKSKSVPEDVNKTNADFSKRVADASSFAHLSASLEDMIAHCRERRMKKTKRLLTFLHLKCRKMKCLEAAGCRVHRKLRLFRREVCGALSAQGPSTKTVCFSAGAMRKVCLRRHLMSVRTRFLLFSQKTDLRATRRQKATELPLGFEAVRHSRAGSTAVSSNSADNCDIDDIFAAAGL